MTGFSPACGPMMRRRFVGVVDNAFAESFNATVRRECLPQHWFWGLEDAGRLLRRWRDEYNNDRSHSSLGRVTPAESRAGRSGVTDRIEARRVAERLD